MSDIVPRISWYHISPKVLLTTDPAWHWDKLFQHRYEFHHNTRVTSSWRKLKLPASAGSTRISPPYFPIPPTSWFASSFVKNRKIFHSVYVHSAPWAGDASSSLFSSNALGIAWTKVISALLGGFIFSNLGRAPPVASMIHLVALFTSLVASSISSSSSICFSTSVKASNALNMSLFASENGVLCGCLYDYATWIVLMNIYKLMYVCVLFMKRNTLYSVLSTMAFLSISAS